MGPDVVEKLYKNSIYLIAVIPSSLQPGADSKLMAHTQPTSNLRFQQGTGPVGTFPRGVSQKEGRGTNFLPLYKVQPTPVVTGLFVNSYRKENPTKLLSLQSIH